MGKRAPSVSVVRTYLSNMARLSAAMSHAPKDRGTIGDIMSCRRVLSSIEKIYDLGMPGSSLKQ